MNNEDKLIYEAYLEENMFKSAALGLACAIGVGCSTIPRTDQSPEANEKREKNTRIFKSILEGILPFIMGLKEKGSITPEVEARFLRDVEQVMATDGTPSEGWELWVNNWFIENA